MANLLQSTLTDRSLYQQEYCSMMVSFLYLLGFMLVSPHFLTYLHAINPHSIVMFLEVGHMYTHRCKFPKMNVIIMCN